MDSVAHLGISVAEEHSNTRERVSDVSPMEVTGPEINEISRHHRRRRRGEHFFRVEGGMYSHCGKADGRARFARERIKAVLVCYFE